MSRNPSVARDLAPHPPSPAPQKREVLMAASFDYIRDVHNDWLGMWGLCGAVFEVRGAAFCFTRPLSGERHVYSSRCKKVGTAYLFTAVGVKDVRCAVKKRESVANVVC